MRWGLKRAAEELKEDIKKYDIIVDAEAGVMGRGNSVMTVPYGMDQRTCRRHLKAYIKQAKDEEAAKLQEKQASLFE